MEFDLNKILSNTYNKLEFEISNFQTEVESKKYQACRFELNGLQIIYRHAKVTPQKVGQFVTFWKRNSDGIIEPLHKEDEIDFYVVNISNENQFGQFVFPKSALITKGIISTNTKEGKRGFRVFPPWDKTVSKQASKTQKWQIKYFCEIGEGNDKEKLLELYNASKE